MLRVAVIGAGLPGLIMADALRAKNCEVLIFGQPNKARSTFEIGPMYLWHGTRTIDWLQRHGMSYSSASALKTKKVSWNGKKDIEGYNEKTGTTASQVCGGKETFKIHACGLAGVWDCLGKTLSMCKDIEVDCVEWLEGRHWLISVGEIQYCVDYIVNTTARNIWNTLCGTISDSRTSKGSYFKYIFYLVSTEPPIGPSSDHDTIYYCGDKYIDWFRASYSYRISRWVYESDEPFQVCKPGEKMISFPAKINPNHPEASSSQIRFPNYGHYGRWATLDPEEMVSDLLRDCNSFARDIVEAHLEYL